MFSTESPITLSAVSTDDKNSSETGMPYNRFPIFAITGFQNFFSLVVKQAARVRTDK